MNTSQDKMALMYYEQIAGVTVVLSLVIYSIYVLLDNVENQTIGHNFSGHLSYSKEHQRSFLNLFYMNKSLCFLPHKIYAQFLDEVHHLSKKYIEKNIEENMLFSFSLYKGNYKMDLINFKLNKVNSIIVYKNKTTPIGIFTNKNSEFELVESNDIFSKELQVQIKRVAFDDDFYYFEQRLVNQDEDFEKEKINYTFCVYTLK